MTVRTSRLGAGDVREAKALFRVMARVFDEEDRALRDGYVARLLERAEFFVIAAFAGDAIVGGLTAHALPMTRSESSEIFIYDLAVSAEHQRRGVGRQLVSQLRAEAASLGVHDVFVAADEDDGHALDFYRAIGGWAAPVTMFTFSGAGEARGER